jgi:hypothetical protein
LRNHIAFAPGQFSPGTTEGRRLIAHELTHTFQQAGRTAAQPVFRSQPTSLAAIPEDERRAIGVSTTVQAPAVRNLLHGITNTLQQRGAIDLLQRTPAAPTPAPAADVRPTEQLHIYMKATAVKGSIPPADREEAAGGTVGPFYPGDTIYVQVWKDLIQNGAKAGLNAIPEPITPTFSSGEVAVAEVLQSSFMLRVVGDPGPMAVEMTLASPAFAQPLKVWIVLESAPTAADVRDPTALARAADLDRLRASRRAARKSPRAERRQIRRDLRQARRALAEYDETAEFSRYRQSMIQAAIKRGIAKATLAIARAVPGKPPDESVALNLEVYFKITSTPATAALVRDTLRRIVDVLSLARNSMLTAAYGQFEIGDNCDEETGAYVSELARGKTVTICKNWIEGELDFGVTTSKTDGQAFALLHEFVHLSGITAGGKELYNHQGEWAAVTPEQALTMADAYAAFAWTLGGGS